MARTQRVAHCWGGWREVDEDGRMGGWEVAYLDGGMKKWEEVRR